MADNKISELPAITGANLADADEFVVVDSSSAQTNRITRTELVKGLFAGSTNVGIGTVSPTDKLNISSSSNQIGLDTGNQATYGTLDLGHFTNGAFIGTQAGSNAASNVLRFGTSGSEAMRLTSSGDLLVGKTASSFNATGLELEGQGRGRFTRDGAVAIQLNRLNSDGDLALFYKDGTNVGSIGVGQSSDLYIGTSDTGILTSSSESITPWNPSTNVGRDDAIDLGTSDHRFRNLYLSSGVYLGGTSGNNALTDYEIGFFEPSLIGSTSDPTVTWDTIVGQEGYYVKVGRMVHIQINFRTDSVSGGSGSLFVGNLPFTSPAVAGQGGVASFAIARAASWGGDAPSSAYINEGTNFIVLEYRTSANGSASNVQVSDLGTGSNNNLLCISGTYYTVQ